MMYDEKENGSRSR